MFQLWHRLIEVINLSPRFVMSLLEEEYHSRVRDRWGESIFRDVVNTSDFAISTEFNIGEQHSHIANTRRSSLYYCNLEKLPIQNEGLFPSSEAHPIIFEEIIIRENHKPLG